ncbi:MAG: hypothetical protein ACK5Z5_08795 [Neisseriaceae bacterium]
MYQMNFICLDDLVSQNHEYRNFVKIWSWSFVNAEKMLCKLKKDNNNEGYGIQHLLNYNFLF